MPVNLTNTAIDKAWGQAKADGERRELSDAREPGLRIRLTPPSQKNADGSRLWVLCCRDRLGAMRRFSLGEYDDRAAAGPDATKSGMGLSEARVAARALRLEVRERGHDPVAEARQDRALGKAARAGEGTLKAMLDLYENGPGKALKSWAHSRKRVDLIFKPLMERPAVKLTPRDLQAAADSYPAQQSASFAVRTIRPALKWLAHRGHVPATLADLRQPTAVIRRQRVLSEGELGVILPKLAASDKKHATMLRFLLLTAARLNEAGEATWGNVKLGPVILAPPDEKRGTAAVTCAGLWTITETKNTQPHVVPLSTQAAALLASIRPKEPKAEARIFATKGGAALGNWDRTCKAFMEASGTEGWHRHDLRRTAATTMGDLGVMPDVIEAALNHTSIRSPLAATYNRSRYRPQVAEALQSLADKLDGLRLSTQASPAITSTANADSPE